MKMEKVEAPGYGRLNEFWSPAVTDGDRIFFSAIGGKVANPDYHVRTATVEKVEPSAEGNALLVGTSMADQIRIIFSHITDVLDAQGKTLNDLSGFTLIFRPGVSKDQVESALHALSSQMGTAPYTLTTLFCDFLGVSGELVQVIPHSR